MIRILLNGKKAAREDIRQAVKDLREQGHHIEVRPTWEGGDIARLVQEAHQDKVTRIVAAGGDGTINEVIDALLTHQLSMEVAILPLGTANDFAIACKIPTNSVYQALQLALTGKAYSVDAAKANERHFINVATAGFGAQVTASTPVALKNLLGGGAYTISGIVQAIGFQPFDGKFITQERDKPIEVVVGAICNGRQAGGGVILAPTACIDSGVLDCVSLHAFTPADIPQVIAELHDSRISEGEFVSRLSLTQFEWQSNDILPINLDGEPLSSHHIVFKVLPKVVQLVLPENCPLLVKNN